VGTKPITGSDKLQTIFSGIGFSKIAFSTANPNLVVAATAADNGLCLGEEAASAGNNGPGSGRKRMEFTRARLYYRRTVARRGNRATLTTGRFPLRHGGNLQPAPGSDGTFYAFIRRHGCTRRPME